MISLKDRVAVVTGASSGIGAAIAEGLACAGCHVVLAARRRDRIEDLARRLHRETGVRALAVPTDVRLADDVHALMARAAGSLGGFDILVNNAGLGIYGAVDEIDRDDLRHVFDVNFFGAVTALQAAVPLMRRRGGGTIVMVSSIVGKFPSPLQGGYTASKYALEGLSGAARAELAADNINVVVVRPGLTATEFAEKTRISVPGAGWMNEKPNAALRYVSAERVARRTVRAIQRGERAVYVTWYDHLAVWITQLLPGPFARVLRLLTWMRRRRFARAQRQQTVSEADDPAQERKGALALPPWVPGLIVLSGVLWWRRRR